MLHSYEDYRSDPFLATQAIGALLGRGCLSLFLGAGVSAGFGLPEWVLLVARLVGRGEDEEYLEELRNKSDKDLAKLIDPVDNGTPEYLGAVHQSLYLDVAKSLLDQLQRSPLLLAVAALITGSCRGRIQCIFTHNYDDLLEQYLRMLGHAVCVRTAPSDFSTRADVEINHVHGYLPQSWTPEDEAPELILSGKSYRARRAGIDEGWSSYVENSLYSKAALFLGLSGDDSAPLDVLKRAQKHIERPDDYNGYWLMTPSAFDRNASDILDVGMCPISLEKDKLPEFVFRVCQQALR